MRLANSPINWSNEDLRDLGGDVSLEQCLSEMHESGFAGTEFGYKMAKNSATCRAQLQEHELQLVSSWHSYYAIDGEEKTEVENLRAKCEFLADAGAERINLCDTSRTVHTTMGVPLSTRPRFTDAEWDRLAAALNRAGAICLEYGLRPGYHHHMGTAVQSAEDVDRLMAMTDPACLWLCYDSGHALFAGDDPFDLAQRHASRIGHVHFKDCREEALAIARRADSSFLQAVLDGVFTVPGGGMIDFAPIVGVLREAGYDDWIVVEAEQYPDDVTPLEFAHQSYAYLNALLTA